MSQLIPTRIVLHCGLHKTGSTYLPRNLQTNRELLLEQDAQVVGVERALRGRLALEIEGEPRQRLLVLPPRLGRLLRLRAAAVVVV